MKKPKLTNADKEFACGIININLIGEIVRLVKFLTAKQVLKDVRKKLLKEGTEDLETRIMKLEKKYLGDGK